MWMREEAIAKGVSNGEAIQRDHYASQMGFGGIGHSARCSVAPTAHFNTDEPRHEGSAETNTTNEHNIGTVGDGCERKGGG
jgi:hypothetical protein